MKIDDDDKKQKKVKKLRISTKSKLKNGYKIMEAVITIMASAIKIIYLGEQEE